jgi:hypothetical protein
MITPASGLTDVPRERLSLYRSMAMPRQVLKVQGREGLDLPVLTQHLAPLHPRLARFANLHSGTQSVQVAVIDFPAAEGPQHHP